MKKLTKKFVKKEISKHLLENEKMLDIYLYCNNMSAKVITITKYHIPQIYIMCLDDNNEIRLYFNVLNHDHNITFNDTIATIKL